MLRPRSSQVRAQDAAGRGEPVGVDAPDPQVHSGDAGAAVGVDLGQVSHAGYERDGVPAGARTRLATLLGDAVIEGLIGSNPALRQRHRGRRSGVRTAGRRADKPVLQPLQWLQMSERIGVLSGRDDEFVLGLLLTFGALRYGEAIGLQRPYMRPAGIRVDWQMEEIDSRWYVLPPKDDSNRDVDLPPMVHNALTQLIAAHPERRCACRSAKIEGQKEQPCQGGLPCIFVGPKGGHPRNGNFSSRVWAPAADGRYPTSSGERRPDTRAVAVELDSAWPGVPVPSWPRAVPGVPYERPTLNGYSRRPPKLGVNVASSRAQLVAFAVEQGVPEEEARAMTRQLIIDRFIRSQYLTADTPVASWLPILDGLTPHQVRHAHSTLLHGLGTPLRLRDDRMGHVSPEMRGMRMTYTDILPEWRTQLRGDLQRVAERTLAERAWFGLHSPVRMLDALLEPFRDGRRKPVSPMPTRAKVIPLEGRSGWAGQGGPRTHGAFDQKSPAPEILESGVFPVQSESPQTESNR
ncbi:hypothetical protein OHA25_02590 [Nonomuraea sp. NBC_00507]|uniref:hypothetical protein n=1 Tax=Nonomuraea sp. NBC_00507 TaxID=2976002 RepID=UPI002E171311